MITSEKENYQITPSNNDKSWRCNSPYIAYKSVVWCCSWAVRVLQSGECEISRNSLLPFLLASHDDLLCRFFYQQTNNGGHEQPTSTRRTKNYIHIYTEKQTNSVVLCLLIDLYIYVSTYIRSAQPAAREPDPPEHFLSDPRSRLKSARNFSWMTAILWKNLNFVELLKILQLTTCTIHSKSIILRMATI